MTIRLGHAHRERGVLLGYALPAMLASAMVAAVNWLCAAMLANRPGGYADLGIYNAANQWFLAVSVLPLIIGRAAFPVLTEQLSQNNRDNSRWIIWASIRANIAVALPVVLGGCLLSRSIMQLYGPAFAEAWPTLIAALVTGGLSIVHVPFTTVIWSLGRMWTALWLNFVWGLAFCLATHLLIDRGSLGLAAARLLATTVAVVGTAALASREMGIRRPSAEPALR
jgi:O-antigen/teichoic acid export membrane protein